MFLRILKYKSLQLVNCYEFLKITTKFYIKILYVLRTEHIENVFVTSVNYKLYCSKPHNHKRLFQKRYKLNWYRKTTDLLKIQQAFKRLN